MSEPDLDDLEKAIHACRIASAKMTPKKSFRLRTLLQMLLNELEKERLLHGTGSSNGRKDQPNGNH